MKVLVTGSSGHLGEAIIRLLIDRNIEYSGLDLKSSKYTTHLGSLTDRQFVKDSVKDVNAIIHTATLHKPHIVTNSKTDFIETNLLGTLNLLEEASLNDIQSFIYSSTTSTFGDMLKPKTGDPAIWITERITSIPKNIYGVTKLAAEDLCHLFYRNNNLPCVILKIARFFQEEDDDIGVSSSYDDLNSKANELLYRRVDIEDAAIAHILAMAKAPGLGFNKYIISATSPFTIDDLSDLTIDAQSVVLKKYPEYKDLYEKKGWKMFSKIDRVYVNSEAIKDLDWNPKYNFRYVLDCLKQNIDYRSQLSIDVGNKGY